MSDTNESLDAHLSAIKTAEDTGFQVIDITDTMVACDLDSIDAVNWFERSVDYWDQLGIPYLYVDRYKSKTESHQHALIYLKCSETYDIRLIWARALGSDPAAVSHTRRRLGLGEPRAWVVFKPPNAVKV